MSAPDDVAIGTNVCQFARRRDALEGGYAVILRAYFDASGRQNGQFCVAGFVFTKSAAKRAEKAWRIAFDGKMCHMADLHGLRGAFSTSTKEQTEKYIRSAIRVLKAHYSYAVAVSCNLAVIERLAPQKADPGSAVYLDGFRRAYATCAHMAMTLVKELLEKDGRSEEIAYAFEAGDVHQAESARFASLVGSVPLMRHIYRERSRTYLQKSDAVLLETADVLAWEWAKHVDRVQTNDMAARPSLEALLGGKERPIGKQTYYTTANCRAIHLPADALEKYFSQIEKYVLSDDAPIHPKLLELVRESQ